MLDFSDKPYRYFPPRYSRVWSRLLLYHNRTRHLPQSRRIEAVQLRGEDRLRQAMRPGDRLLFLPNHPTHADAAILLESLRQIGERSLMMAAYDVFLRGLATRFIMQRMGAFAVDRDGSDARPMKQAMKTLEDGRFALTLFPEGNVYLTNDRVTPFMDGAAFIALRTQQTLMKSDTRVLAVPVSIKATHTTNARELIAQRFRPLAAQLGVEADLKSSPVEALVAVGGTALHRNLKQRGLDVPEAESLAALVPAAAGRVLERLETKLDLTPKPKDALFDRIRAARRVIHEVRTDPKRAVDHAAAATWADEAMLAFRIASYPVGYAAEKPTLDRVGETVEKLEEDMLTKMPEPVADRHATVMFNEPIDLRGYLADGAKLRAATRQFTSDCEASVQAGLDAINGENPYPGGKMWCE